MDLLGRRNQVAVGGQERVLHGVLGLLRVTQHVPAEGQDRAMMAVVNRLEGTSIPFPNKGD